uniref:Exportin-4 n=1 Tax=Ditylenchus dipsaci TaxID=166011 RepID=A0A915E1V3_9BILA
MTEIGDNMMLGFLQCISLALHNQFGLERLLIISHLCTLISKVFEISLQYSCEVDVFGEASNALYSLICLNKENFSMYVGQLLNQPENAPHAARIQEAFCRLLPDGHLELGRLEKRSFHDRLDKFLVEIHGLLCLT